MQPNSYGWFATQHANLSAGQRILLVTTDIYSRLQHADVRRMLALPCGAEIER